MAQRTTSNDHPHDIIIKEEPVDEDEINHYDPACATPVKEEDTSQDHLFNVTAAKDDAWAVGDPSLTANVNLQNIFINTDNVMTTININGQDCMMLRLPTVTRNDPWSSVNPLVAPKVAGSQEVYCPRCKKKIPVNVFRQHIDTCPPRPMKKWVNNSSAGEEVPCLSHKASAAKAADSASHVRPENEDSLIMNSLEISGKFEESIEDHSVSVSLHDSRPQGRGAKPAGDDSSQIFRVQTERTSTQSEHAKQLMYYQKLVEIRNKCSSERKRAQNTLGDVHTEKQQDTDNSLLLQDTTFSCSVCSFTSDKQRHLRDHERTHNTSQSVLRCVYCNQKYTRHALYLHIQRVHPGQKFDFLEESTGLKDTLTCKLCQFVAQNPLILKRHVQKHREDTKERSQSSVWSSSGNQSRYRCGECSYVCDSVENSRKHQRAHQTNLKISQCPNCEFKSTPRALEAHLLKCQESRPVNCDVNETGKISCKKCSYTCTTPGDFAKHNRAHQRRLAISKCKFCDFKSTPRALAYHVRRCSLLPRPLADKGTLCCKLCAFQTPNRYSLNAHMKIHKSANLKCSWCEFRATKGKLMKHMEECEGNLTQKQTTNKAASSVRVKTRPKLFSCGVCSFSTNLRIKLKRHVSKRHSRPNRRTDHVRYQENHSDDEEAFELQLGESLDVPPKKHQFSCDKCSFVTNLRIKLNVHRKTHEKRFECQQCSFVTGFHFQLKQHILSHKTRPVAQCPGCDFKSTFTQVRKHKRECQGVATKQDETPQKSDTKSDTQVMEHAESSISIEFTHKRECQQEEATMQIESPEKLVDTEFTHVANHKKECQQEEATMQTESPEKLVDTEFTHVANHKKECQQEEATMQTESPEKLVDTEFTHVANHKKECQQEEASMQPKMPDESDFKTDEDVESKRHAKSPEGFAKIKELGENTVAPEPHNSEGQEMDVNRPKEIDLEDNLQLEPQLVEMQTDSPADNAEKSENKPSPSVVDTESMPQFLGFTESELEQSGNAKELAQSEVKAEVKSEPQSKRRSQRVVKAGIKRQRESPDKEPANEQQQREKNPKVTWRIKLKPRSLKAKPEPELKQIIFKCRPCAFFSTRANEFDRHTRTKKHRFNLNMKKPKTEKKLRQWKCDSCLFTAISKSKLKAHRHKRNRRLKCPQCSFVATKAPLSKHIRTTGHFSNKWAKIFESLQAGKCKLCSVSGLAEVAMKRHMRTHASSVTLKCKLCDFKSTMHYLRKHVKEAGHQVKRERKVKVHKCPECDYQTTKKMLRIHAKCHVNNEAIIQCTRCDFKATSLALHEHIKETAHYDRTIVPEGSTVNKLQCTLCSVVLKTSQSLYKHMVRHKSSRIIKCEKCNFKATHVHMRAHTQTEHAFPKIEAKSTDFLCKHCPFSTSLRIKLKMHLKKNHQKNRRSRWLEVSFVCLRCPFATPLPLSLKEHEESAHGAEQITCKFCSYATLDPATYEQHLSMHYEGDQPIFQCPLCRLKMVPNKVRTHGRKCQGVINVSCKVSFACAHCTFTTHSPAALKLHEDNEHPEKLEPMKKKARLSDPVHTCRFCSYTTLHGGDMENHTQIHYRFNKPVLQCVLCKCKGTVPSVRRHHCVPANENPKSLSENQAKELAHSCTLCSFTSTTLKRFKAHMKWHYSSNAPILKCRHCQFKATTKTFAQHKHPDVANNAPVEALLTCSQCSFTTRFPVELRDHKSSHAIPNQFAFDANKLKYDCKLCSFTSSSENNVRRHISRHYTSNLPIFQCQYCQFKKSGKMVRTHKNCLADDEQRKKPLVKVWLSCSKCSFTTYYPATLRAHENSDHSDIRTVSNIGPIKSFKCEYCSFTTYWQYLLERHMHSHTVLKLPIEQCPNCDFRSTPASLAAHVNRCTKKYSDLAAR